MSKLNDLIMGRFKTTKKDNVGKLVERSGGGMAVGLAENLPKHLMSEAEKTQIADLLEKYSVDEAAIHEEDKEALCSLTAEIKSIHNQSIILHGERIKKAQEILKKYDEGAFSSFLIHTYGNRQTPYNFLLYYEFYTSVSTGVQKLIDPMPKQAIYSLSSRDVSKEEKVEFVKNYQGETKTQLLERLRDHFPLKEKDKRKAKPSKHVELLLEKALAMVSKKGYKQTESERKKLLSLLGTLSNKISNA